MAYHNSNFVAIMDNYLPEWIQLKMELNKLPVSHVEWGYCFYSGDFDIIFFSGDFGDLFYSVDFGDTYDYEQRS
jgi:hypothetical protein